jgi:hypothetical protein
MRKILILAIILFGSQAWGATYYVKAGGNDSAAGTSDETAWAHCPGLDGWTGSAVLQSGDTIYFDNEDTWQTTAGSRLLSITTSGTTWDGSTWGDGTGTRAKLDSLYDQSGNEAGIIGVNDASNVTIKGFEVDGNNNRNYGISIGRQSSVDMDSITIENCDVHHILDDVVGWWGYGINLNSTAGTGNANDLTSSDGDAANPVVSSASYTFDSGDIGEEFAINGSESGGFTNGGYTITGVSGGDAILDAPCGSNGSITGGGWWFKGITISNTIIKDTTVRDCAHEGLALYQSWSYPTNKTDTVLIQNCNIYNNNSGLLIANDSQNVTIQDSNIYNNVVQGVYIRVTFAVFDKYYPYGPQGMVFRRNNIYGNDIYGIQIVSPTIKMTGQFYNNFIYGNGDGGGSNGVDIFIGGHTDYNYANSELYFYNNTIASFDNTSTNYSGGVYVGLGGTDIGPADIQFKNNIIYSEAAINQSAFRLLWDRWDMVTHSNNLFYRASGESDTHVLAGSSYDRSEVTDWETSAEKTDPDFVNAGGDDYTVNVGSDAINNGEDLSAYFTRDYYGTSRPMGSEFDIGAFENQSPNPSAPTNLRIVN